MQSILLTAAAAAEGRLAAELLVERALQISHLWRLADGNVAHALEARAHLRVLREARAHRLQTVLVLEDDIRLVDGFHGQLFAALATGSVGGAGLRRFFDALLHPGRFRGLQPVEPENPDEPPETVYGYLLNCLREISFEKYPRVITENIDGPTVSIVRFVLDHYSKPRTPSLSPAESNTISPMPPVSPSDDVVPTGGNTTSQLPRKKYVLVSVSVDTIPVESGLAVWQVRTIYLFFIEISLCTTFV